MHVNDVGSDRYVYGDRNPEPRGRRRDAVARELRLFAGKEAGYRLADPEAGGDAVVDRGIEQPAGFLRHAEAARAERFVDVLGGRADERDLEVVNNRRAVGRERRD